MICKNFKTRLTNSQTYFNLILITFQLFLMNHIKLHKKPNNFVITKFYQFFNYIQIIILVIYIGAIYWFENRIFFKNDVVGYLNDVMKISSLIASWLIVLLNSNLSGRALNSFWSKYAYLTKTFGCHCAWQKFRKYFVRKFCIGLVVFVAALAFKVVSYHGLENGKIFWGISVAPLLIEYLFFINFVLYVNIIEYFVRRCNARLSRYTTYEELKKVKSGYGIVADCVQNVNWAFGLPLISTMAHCFVQLAGDMYWIYVLIKDNYRIYQVFVLCSLKTLFIILICCHACNACLNQTHILKSKLHAIDVPLTDRKLDNLIERFAFQLKKEQFLFTAFGFFDIDYRLLKNISVVISTYVIIFIQFAPTARFIPSIRY